MEDFKEYYGQRVNLVVDGRGYDTANYSVEANVSLELQGTPVSETDRFLKLEKILVLNNTRHEKSFARGSINKEYIIGILEAP